MTKRVRAILVLVSALGMMGMAGCGHYVCQATFGDSTCTSSGTTTVSQGDGPTPNAFIYHVDQLGSVDGYQLNESTPSTFTWITGFTAPTIPTNLGSAGLVEAQGKFLYGVFPDLGQIYGWSVGSNGALTPISGLPLSVTLTVGSPIYNVQEVITNPAGTLLFISEAGLNQILVYQISSTGTLTSAPGSPFATTGLEPQNMGMDGLGKFLYVSEDSGDHEGSFIAGYTVSSTGALQQIGTGTMNYPLWQMQGDPTGQYLIGISGKVSEYVGTDDDSIYVFSINSTTGALTPVTNSPFTTVNAPFDIAVQPASKSGAFIYSFSFEASNAVEGYQLDTSTGALTAVAGSPFSGISSTFWGQFDPSGAYMFFYNATGATGGTTTTESGNNAFVVPSNGDLGTTEGPGVTWATNGYWTVVDVP